VPRPEAGRCSSYHHDSEYRGKDPTPLAHRAEACQTWATRCSQMQGYVGEPNGTSVRLPLGQVGMLAHE
jgi:hypothetical protein